MFRAFEISGTSSDDRIVMSEDNNHEVVWFTIINDTTGDAIQTQLSRVHLEEITQAFNSLTND